MLFMNDRFTAGRKNLNSNAGDAALAIHTYQQDPNVAVIVPPIGFFNEVSDQLKVGDLMFISTDQVCKSFLVTAVITPATPNVLVSQVTL